MWSMYKPAGRSPDTKEDERWQYEYVKIAAKH
jgi:hypothetical protein